MRCEGTLKVEGGLLAMNDSKRFCIEDERLKTHAWIDWDYDINAILDSLIASSDPIELVCTNPVYAEAIIACFYHYPLEDHISDLDIENPRFACIAAQLLMLNSRFDESARRLLPLAEESDYGMRILAHLGIALYAREQLPMQLKKIDELIPGPAELPITEASGTVFWYNWFVRQERDQLDVLDAMVEGEPAPFYALYDVMAIVGLDGLNMFGNESVMLLAESAIDRFPRNQAIQDLYYRAAFACGHEVSVSPEEAIELAKYIGMAIWYQRRYSHYCEASAYQLMNQSLDNIYDLWVKLSREPSQVHLLTKLVVRGCRVNARNLLRIRRAPFLCDAVASAAARNRAARGL